MKADFYFKNEYEITRSDCNKLIFTTHRIIRQNKEGKFTASVDLLSVSSIDRYHQRNKWFALLAIGMIAGTASAYIMGLDFLYMIGLSIPTLAAIALYVFNRKETIVISTDQGEHLKVHSSSLKINSKSLIGNLEAARFQLFNQSHKKGQAPKKDTKVVKITA